MRQFIFEFEQEQALRLGITLDELLILDYFSKFFKTDRAVVRRIEGNMCFLIRYSKLVKDLPIIAGSDRTMRRHLKQLDQKGIIKRYLVKHSLFIFVDWKKIFWDETNPEVGQYLQAIVNIPHQ